VLRKPEIMSPAGHWPQLHAAIEAGADSVYFGLKHFSARAKVGFSLDELPLAIRTLHRRGVKGFIAFNTLIFENELAEAAETIAAIGDSGADAIIVQDPAILKLARQIAPHLELHASTQMSISDAAGVNFARSLGAARVTLARELSLAEIAAIRRATDCELEIFVHGALCVAYSGQCFSSEAWGGRSANRGQCAQACRLPYDLIVDDRPQPLADARYLLSPGDLCTIDHVPQIVELGISAVKIEGRYKDAEYVALTTRAYRQAVDAAFTHAVSPVTPLDKLHLEQVYSRGLGAHFLSGTNHQTVVKGRAPRHRGVLAGRVTRVLPNAVEIESARTLDLAPLKPGDGLVFDAADWRSPQEAEEGGRLYEVAAQAGKTLQLRFANGAVNFSRIRAGDLVWRSHDPDLDRLARPYLEPAAPVRKQQLTVTVTAHEGEPLSMEWVLKSGDSVVTVSPEPLARARDQGLTESVLTAQLNRLGNTPYEIGSFKADILGAPFAPASLLNQLRREAVEVLQALQARVLVPRAVAFAGLCESATRRSRADEDVRPTAQLHLLVRTPAQLDAALETSPASITLDYLDLYGLKPSVERVKAAGIAVRVASPRILKPGEERIVDFLNRLDAPLLVRSTGLLELLRGKGRQDLTGDFSLNPANSITASELLSQGLLRITPTHDLNAEQIGALASQIGGGHIEAIAYQHLPVFHTEHCVFCRFLSSGTSYKDCGRPCEKHTVSLRDLNGRAHPLMADVGCRNTVFGAEAQEASAWLDDWRAAGICHFRLEFAHESAEDVLAVTRAFAQTLRGTQSCAQLAQQLKRLAPQGTTAGSLFVPLSELAGATSLQLPQAR
jgi:putative protease